MNKLNDLQAGGNTYGNGIMAQELSLKIIPNCPRLAYCMNSLSTLTLDDKFTVLCSRIFRSHLQVGAAVSSHAHLMNALVTSKGKKLHVNSCLSCTGAICM